MLAHGLASIPSRLVLTCGGAPRCFPEKASAMRTGTAQSMLIRHASSCVTPVASLIDRLEAMGTFLPYCDEFRHVVQMRSPLGEWAD